MTPQEALLTTYHQTLQEFREDFQERFNQPGNRYGPLYQKALLARQALERYGEINEQVANP